MQALFNSATTCVILCVSSALLITQRLDQHVLAWLASKCLIISKVLCLFNAYAGICAEDTNYYCNVN